MAYDEYVVRHGKSIELERALNELSMKGYVFVNVSYTMFDGLKFALIMKRSVE